MLTACRAIVTDVIGSPFEQPVVHQSENSEFTVILSLSRYQYSGPSGLSIWTRSFNDEIAGPTIRIKPGDTFHIQLTNNLESEAFDTAFLHNVFKDFDVTNVHTHGLHIHGEAPGDDVFTAVSPGQTYTYTYEVPSNHMGGTFWCAAQIAPGTCTRALGQPGSQITSTWPEEKMHGSDFTKRGQCINTRHT